MANFTSDPISRAVPRTFPPEGDDINATLIARGSRYGDFDSHAIITQLLKDVMWQQKKWQYLKPAQKEALEMIAHKIGRILNGDPNYKDSWIDIAGYAQLVANMLKD